MLVKITWIIAVMAIGALFFEIGISEGRGGVISRKLVILFLFALLGVLTYIARQIW